MIKFTICQQHSTEGEKERKKKIKEKKGGAGAEVGEETCFTANNLSARFPDNSFTDFNKYPKANQANHTQHCGEKAGTDTHLIPCVKNDADINVAAWVMLTLYDKFTYSQADTGNSCSNRAGADS